MRGDLVHTTIDRFVDCVEQSLQPPPASLHIDLRLITFIDSGGGSALIVARNRAERAGTGLILEQHPAPTVHQILRYTGLTEFFGLSRP